VIIQRNKVLNSEEIDIVDPVLNVHFRSSLIFSSQSMVKSNITQHFFDCLRLPVLLNSLNCILDWTNLLICYIFHLYRNTSVEFFKFVAIVCLRRDQIFICIAYHQNIEFFKCCKEINMRALSKPNYRSRALFDRLA
jgi:hypothetical protein